MEKTAPIRVLLFCPDAQQATSFSRKLDASHEILFETTIVQNGGSKISKPTDVALVYLPAYLAKEPFSAETIRQVAGPLTPVVLIANSKTEPRARECLRNGVQDYLLEEEITPMLLAKTLAYVVRLSRQEKALRENEERYRMMIDYSSDIITLVDRQGKIIFENPSVERIFGYKPNEIEGQVIFDYIHPDERIQVMEKFKEAMEQRILNDRIEFRFLTKSGKWRFIEAIGSTVLDEKNGLIAIINSRDITDRVEMEKELYSMTIDDPLTGLLNRRGFMILSQQQLKLAKRTKQGSCLIYVDLDQLKWINDTFGHIEGDKALVETALILKSSFRDPDIIARLGGDEFVVLAIGAHEIHAGSLLSRVQESLKARNQNPIHPYPLSFSMGVIYVDPRHQLSVENMLSRADHLMYQDKRMKQKPA